MSEKIINFHFKHLSELEQLVYHSNVTKLKQYFTEMECNFNHAPQKVEKIPNLIIVACKFNKLECLECMFNRDIVDIIVKINGEFFKPEEKDKTNHNAFYYSLLSVNTNLIDYLINTWPDNYFTIHSNDLDHLLSSSYQEIEINHVLIQDEMKLYVLNKLLNLRFFSFYPQSEIYSNKNLKGMITLLIDTITNLLKFSNINEQFLHHLQFIAKIVYTLKSILKCTYNKLPWEEIEFCLVAFILSHKQNQGNHLLYRAILNFSKIQSHLKCFLEQLRQLDLEQMDTKDMPVLPPTTREEIVNSIKKSFPEFKCLYEDFRLIRDIYSLSKIDEAMKLALSVDTIKREGQLAIFRSLQIIGEFLRNTLESPNLSKVNSDMLLLALPANSRNIVLYLQNATSHSYISQKRLEIEENINTFSEIQNDLKKISNIVLDLLEKIKVEILVDNLKEIKVISDISYLKEILHVLKAYAVDDTSICQLFNARSHFENIVRRLNEKIEYKTFYEKEIFIQIFDIIKNGKEKSMVKTDTLIESFKLIVSSANMVFLRGISENRLRMIKYHAHTMLQNINHYYFVEEELQQLHTLTLGLFKSFTPRLGEHETEIIKLSYEWFSVIKYEGCQIKFFDEIISKMLTPPHCISLQNFEKCNSDLLYQELKNILSDKGINEYGDCCFFKSIFKNKIFLASVQVLLLDLMSLESQQMFKTNILSLYDYSFILFGKNLQIHLSHFNHLIDILINDFDAALVEILNAIMLIQINSDASKKSSQLQHSYFQPKLPFERDLFILSNKLNMFNAIESGYLENIKYFLGEGAEVLARDIDHRTCLHYAAKAPDTSVLNFFLNFNINYKFKSSLGESILHVASANGRTETIQLLLKKGLDINILDKIHRSPLHLAVINGHQSTVQFLIKNQARLTQADMFGKEPLHYAIESNAEDIVKLFIETELVCKKYSDHLLKSNYPCLHVAVKEASCEIVEYFISKGADVNASCLDGFTPLHYASNIGHNYIVNMLIRNGAVIDANNTKDGATPIFMACSNGHKDVVKTLLKHGADPDKSNNYGVSPLLESVKNNYEDVVSILIKHGVNIDCKTVGNYTAMHFAATRSTSDILDLIINKGMVNCRTSEHITPLHIASNGGKSQMIESLINNCAEVNAVDIHGFTPLHLAAKGNHRDAVILLMNHKAEVNALDKSGFSPLHLATAHGAKEAVQVLLQNSAVVVNLRNCHDFTPLHVASYLGHTDIAHLLIKYNAKVNSNATSKSPLLLAVEGGHKSMVNLMIEKGANPNYKNDKQIIVSTVKYNRVDILSILISKGLKIKKDDPTALLMAVFGGFKGIIKSLLKEKVNPNIMSYNNQLNFIFDNDFSNAFKTEINEVTSLFRKKMTPLMIASTLGRVDIVEVLLSMGANPNIVSDDGTSALHLAASFGFLKVVEVLLNKGAKSSTKDSDYRTPFELAIGNNNEAVVNLFLSRNDTIINNRGTSEWTPLHIAAQNGNLSIIVSLVEHGADLHLKNAPGSKAIHLAARDGHKDIVEYFLSQGMNVDEPNERNQTPLYCAAVTGELSVVSFLIAKHANPNAVDKYQNRPLHMAAAFNREDVVRYLLKSGAFFNCTNDNFQKPLDITSSLKIKKLLQTIELLYTAVRKNDHNLVEIMIQKGAYINALNSESGSALLYSAWKGFEDVATTLLRNQCNPNIGSKNGFGPLHYAAKYAHYNIALALLMHGAIFNALSSTNKTPLDICTDKSILNLLNIISKCFNKIKTKDTSIIDDLVQIKDTDRQVFNAIMKAQERENKNLVEAASEFDFPKIKELKKISEMDFSLEETKALSFCKQERYDEALNLFNTILKSKREVLDECDLSVLKVEKNIALIYFKTFHYEKALELYKSVYEKQKKMFGQNHIDSLKTNSQIAMVLHRIGRYGESLYLYENTIEKQDEILGSNHESVVESLSEMALVLNSIGRHEEALNINYRVLDHRIKNYGENDLITLVSYNNIGITMNYIGEHDKALNIFEKVYNGRLEKLGPTHSDTLRVQQNIAVTLKQKKRYVEATGVLLKVLNEQMIFLGPNHRDVFQTEYNLAEVAFDQKHSVRALMHLKNCQEIGLNILGHLHSDVSKVENLINIIKCSLNVSYKSVPIDEFLKKIQEDFINSVKKGSIHMVKDWIQRKVDINECDVEGRSPLHFAVNSGNVTIVKLLLDHGADASSISNKGNTPLHLAVSKNNITVTKLLIDQFEDWQLYRYINTKTKSCGTTALHVAAKNGSLEAVRCLLKHGASFDIVNSEGKTPLDITDNDNVSNVLSCVNKCFNMVKLNDENIIGYLKTIGFSNRCIILLARNKEGETLEQMAITKNIFLAMQLRNIE